MTSLKCVLVLLALCALNGCKSDVVFRRNKRAAIIDAHLMNRTYAWTRNISDNQHGHLECSPYGVHIKFNDSFIRSLNVSKVDHLVMLNANKTAFNNSACKVKMVNGSYHFKVGKYFGECAESIQMVEGDHLRVKYRICVVPDYRNVTITRDNAVFLYATCCYKKKLHVSLPHSIIPFASTNIFASEIKPPAPGSALGNNFFALNFHRFTDASFTNIETASNVTDGNSVYMCASVNVDPRFSIVLQGAMCWASTTPNGPKLFYIVKSGCAGPDPVTAGGNVVYNNYQNETFKFSFTGFHWSSLPLDDPKQLIYITCCVFFCDNSTNTCTDHTCPAGRKKRSSRSEPATKKETVSFGPISILPKARISETNCNKDEMGCQYKCAVTSGRGKQCTCPAGMTLQLDGKTCSDDVPKKIVEISNPLQWIHWINVILVSWVAVLVGFLCYTTKNSKKI